MADSTTTSAPSAAGRTANGVAKVLSTTSRAPAACAISATAGMSSSRSVGIGQRLPVGHRDRPGGQRGPLLARVVAVDEITVTPNAGQVAA